MFGFTCEINLNKNAQTLMKIHFSVLQFTIDGIVQSVLFLHFTWTEMESSGKPGSLRVWCFSKKRKSMCYRCTLSIFQNVWVVTVKAESFNNSTEELRYMKNIFSPRYCETSLATESIWRRGSSSIWMIIQWDPD